MRASFNPDDEKWRHIGINLSLVVEVLVPRSFFLPEQAQPIVADLGQTDAFDDLTSGNEGIFAFFPLPHQPGIVFLNKLIIDRPAVLLCGLGQQSKGLSGIIDIKMAPNFRSHAQKPIPHMPGGGGKHLAGVGEE